MKCRIILPMLLGIIVIATFGFFQDVFAEPLTLFPTTFADSFSVAGEDTFPTGIEFSSDGTKMFVVGNSGDDVNEYTLSSAFDVSTASFVDSFSVAGQETGPQGVAFNSNGSKMFVVGQIGDAVNEYTLTTAFTLFHTAFAGSFSVAVEETIPTGVAFSSEGEKMFVVGNADDDVTEYTLSTAFDVSTASFVDSFSVAGQETGPQGVAFNSNGSKMFVVGQIGDAVNEYTLTTAFDVSTASFVDSFSVAGEETIPTGVAFSSEGEKMFVVGDIGADVNEYILSSAFDVSTASFVDSFSVAVQSNSPQGVAFSSDGTKMFVVGLPVDDVSEYTLTTAFDVSTASFVGSFSVAVQDTFPTDIAFDSNGMKMFVVGSVDDAVNEYTLTTAFTLFHTTFADSFSVAGEDNLPSGVAFSSNGTKMFVVGESGSDVNEYTLSTAFDVSTASFVDSFSVAGEEIGPQGVAFSSNGTKMFVVGNFGANVNEYTLSTAFDVSTASFVDSFSVAEEDTFPTDIAISSDGTKMFVVGHDGDDVNEYTLTTVFDVSTASFVGSFSVAVQDTIPSGIAFSSDGTKMFVVGESGDKVNEYKITSFGTCSPPTSGNWVVDKSCTMTSGAIINNGDLIVQNSSVLTIPFTLDINFSSQKVTVESGSGVLIKFGGAIT